MKKSIISNSVVLGIAVMLFLNSCSNDRKGGSEFFSGKITNSKGMPLDSVKVELQNEATLTDKEGNFKIAVKKDTQRYVLNATRKGYGFVSKIYSKPEIKIKITMAKALEKRIDINKVEGELITITDRNPEMTAPPGSNVQLANPLSKVPFVYDANGRLIDFEVPTILQNNQQGLNNFKPPVLGARVEIPKNGLELNGQSSVVDVSIQTIDLYAGDGMPGDNTVRMGDCRGYVKSFGAMNFEISQNGKPVKLKKGVKARITIPVDTISILTKETLSPTIPFLTYNRSKGIWEQEGTSVLNKSKSVYEGWTTHFSTFNMDMTFGSGSTCYQICNNSTATNIEISAPYYHYFTLGAADCDCVSGGGAHAIINMGPFSPCGVRIFNGATLVSTYVFTAGDATALGACPYDGCSGSVAINDTFDQAYVSSNKLGMCHIQLAYPHRSTTSSVAGNYPIRLSWLYEATFGSGTTGVHFKIESSPDNATWSTVIASYASPDELVHHYDPPAMSPSTTTYYRISLAAGGGDSNSVCLTIDAFGTADTSSCAGLTTPNDCF